MASMSLDEVLLRRWDLAESAGVMRTNVEETMRREIPGSLGLVVQFNPSHLKSKRPVDKRLLTPQTASAPTQAKSSGFNFTKAKWPEFLCGLRFDSGDEERLLSVQPVEMTEGRNETDHFVLVNVAPLVRGHVLFVPDLTFVKPQKMTKNFLLYAFSISREILREDFALGFNSAGAWSSVNHFHLQGYFFPHIAGRANTNFPVAAQKREETFRVGGAVVNSIQSWKTTCYVVEPGDAASGGQHVVEVAWMLLEILQSKGTPHNLVVVGMEVFIFPRQPQCENGVRLFAGIATDDATTEHLGRLRIAVAELSGLVIAGDSFAYDNLTEEMFNEVLEKEVSLSTCEEADVVAEWKAKLASGVQL